jgi:nucleoside 2-deoxyribosyltransferase
MSEKKLKLYLAHNLYERHKVRKIELSLEKLFNISLMNPFYDRDRIHIKKLDNKECTRGQFNYADCSDIVKHDKEMIDNCEGIVAYISDNQFHVGTILEIAYAYHCHKIIYIISTKFYNHPWFRVYATKRFKTWIEFIQFLMLRGYGR